MDYKKPQSTLVQGGTGIYPLTTADQVILADGSRLEKDGKISANSAANSEKLGGKSPEYYLQPHNLFDNSNFVDPVMQAEFNGMHGNEQYVIDRWLHLYNLGSSEKVYGGIALTGADFYMAQKVGEDVSGKTLTFAVCLADGTVVCGTENVGDLSSTIVFARHENLHLMLYNGWFSIRIATGTYTIKWAALYEGSYTADTLPPYVPKGYAAELAECQRYYYQSWTDSSPNTFNGVIIREAIALSRATNVVFPQTMRISNPTVTLYSPSTGNIGKASEFISNTEIDAGSVYLSRNGFTLSSTASAFEIGKHYCIHYSVSADL